MSLEHFDELPAQPETDALGLGLSGEVLAAFRELLDYGVAQRRSVTLYSRGQVITGRVIRLWGTDGVELRNPQFDRLLVRLSSVDAVAVP